MRTKSSPSSPLALQIRGPGENEETTRELQVVDPTSSVFSSPPFKLPLGWSIEKRRRLNSPSHPGRVDKYYYEPGTRRQFRSLIAIQNYLSGEAKGAIMPRRVESGNEKKMHIVPCTTKSGSSFGLPDHWIVEERPRRNVNKTGIIDRYYIEPEAGLRFRSRITAERYIAQVGGNTSKTKAKPDKYLSDNNISDENPSLRIMVKNLRDAGKVRTKAKGLNPGSHSVPSTNPSSQQEKHSYGKEINLATLEISCSPAKVKWVLGGMGRSLWNPFVGESMVPESVLQEWSKTFVHTIHHKY